MNRRAAYLDKKIDRLRAYRLRDAVRGVVAFGFNVGLTELRYAKGPRATMARRAMVAALVKFAPLPVDELAELVDLGTDEIECLLTEHAADCARGGEYAALWEDLSKGVTLLLQAGRRPDPQPRGAGLKAPRRKRAGVR